LFGYDLVVINDCSDTWTLKMFLARFGVLKAVLMKIQFFWDVTPCRLVIVINILQELTASISGVYAVQEETPLKH
jgi:hypothetical protein